MAETLDHISDGRAILGIGGAWFELEHQAHGIEFGSGFGQRLDWLDEAVGAMRAVLDGESVTSEPGGHYAFNDLRHQPLPIQKRLPIMIGGSGEKKTLRTVAKYADMWNAMGTPEVMAHKVEVLRGHCDAVGRDIGEIEFTLGVKLTIRDSEAEADRVWKAAMEHNRTPMADVADDDTFWNGSPEQIADRLRPYVELGFHTVISEQPAPYDVETFERFIGEVKPLIDRASSGVPGTPARRIVRGHHRRWDGSGASASGRGRCGVPLSHLALVRRKRGEDFLLLPLRHLDEVQRASEFGRDFVELLRGDLELAMGFFQAKDRAPRSRG